nr:extracellular solute-binding protein [Allonocardiopsis opalescens]
MMPAKIAAVAAALLFAAACGGGAPEGGNAAAGGELDPADAPENLTIWVMGSAQEPLNDFLQNEVGGQFQETYPDTEITVEWIPWDGYADQFQTALAAGEGPDIVEIGNDQNALWASSGALTDITELVGAWDETPNLNPEMLEYAAYDGVQYGVPWYGGVRTLWYRADWLRELGYEPPETWADVEEVAEAIEAEYDVPGFGAPSRFQNGLWSLIWSTGGELAVQNEDGSWEGQIDSPEAVEAFEWWASLTESEISPQSYVGENELIPLADMANGQLGMYIDGSWAIGQMEEQNDEFIEDLAPGVIPGRDGMAPAMAGGSNLSVWANSASPEFAFEFITLLNNQENAARWSELAGFFPAYPALLEDERYQTDPMLAAGARQMTDVRFPPNTPNWAYATQDLDLFHVASLRIAEGEDAATVLGEVNAELTEALNRPIE